MKTNKKRALLVALAVFASSGCGLVPPRDAEYFLVHPDEAKLVVTRCEMGQETGNDCKAAAQAVAKLNAGERGPASAKGGR